MIISTDRISTSMFAFVSLICLVAIGPLSAQQIPAIPCGCQTATPINSGGSIAMQSGMQLLPQSSSTILQPSFSQPLVEALPSIMPTAQPVQLVQPMPAFQPTVAAQSMPLTAPAMMPMTTPAPTARIGGPGTEMTRMINQMGMGSDCGRCKALAAEMDQRGPEWVRQNMDYVVNRTVSNAENLGYQMGPVRRSGVRMMVRRAIRASK